MSGQLVSLIALIPMLVHSLFGCCWHHSHACHTQGQAVALTAASGGASPAGLRCSHAHSGGSHCRSPHHPTHQHPTHQHPTHQHPTNTVIADAGPTPHGSLPAGFPPCEEDRCLYGGMITTVVSPCSCMEYQGDVNFMVIDWPLMRQQAAARVSARADRPWPYTARERCAISQVWLV